MTAEWSGQQFHEEADKVNLFQKVFFFITGLNSTVSLIVMGLLVYYLQQ